VAAFIKPTSLNGGEGLAAGSTGDVGGSESEGRAKRWSRGVQNQPERREKRFTGTLVVVCF